MITATPFKLEPYTPPTYKHGHRWGPWVLDRKRVCLCLCGDESDPQRNFYEVDIERIHSAFDCLDWICQIAGKRLPERLGCQNPEVVGSLVMALNNLFRPQSSMRDGREVHKNWKRDECV